MLTNESLAHDSLSIVVVDSGVGVVAAVVVGIAAVVELSVAKFEEVVLIDESPREERLDNERVPRLLTIIGFRNTYVPSSCKLLGLRLKVLPRFIEYGDDDDVWSSLWLLPLLLLPRVSSSRSK